MYILARTQTFWPGHKVILLKEETSQVNSNETKFYIIPYVDPKLVVFATIERSMGFTDDSTDGLYGQKVRMKDVDVCWKHVLAIQGGQALRQ